MNYASRQKLHDEHYNDAYVDWVQSLTPREREGLRAKGLIEADTSRETGKRVGDATR